MTEKVEWESKVISVQPRIRLNAHSMNVTMDIWGVNLHPNMTHRLH